MKGESERRKAMKKGFMIMREEGYSIAEIAKNYQLGVCTVYQALQEIAYENGVSRDSLLYVVHKSHDIRKERVLTKFEKVNIEELEQDFERILKDVDAIITKIEGTLQLEEDN